MRLSVFVLCLLLGLCFIVDGKQSESHDQAATAAPLAGDQDRVQSMSTSLVGLIKDFQSGSKGSQDIFASINQLEANIYAQSSAHSSIAISEQESQARATDALIDKLLLLTGGKMRQRRCSSFALMIFE